MFNCRHPGPRRVWRRGLSCRACHHFRGNRDQQRPTETIRRIVQETPLGVHFCSHLMVTATLESLAPPQNTCLGVQPSNPPTCTRQNKDSLLESRISLLESRISLIESRISLIESRISLLKKCPCPKKCFSPHGSVWSFEGGVPRISSLMLTSRPFWRDLGNLQNLSILGSTFWPGDLFE